jgi:hypothetical protein
MATQHIRVLLLGFDVYEQTWDDALQRDGRGDEISIRIGIVEVDRNGNRITPDDFPLDYRSEIIGDTDAGLAVVRGGSTTRLFNPNPGGFQTGDGFPQRAPYVPYMPRNPGEDPAEVPPLSPQRPPSLIFEADLEEDRVVFITPIIWEHDRGDVFNDVARGLLDWHKRIDAQFGDKAQEIFGGIFPIAAPFFDAVSLGIQTAAEIPTDTGTGDPGNIPIGWTTTGADLHFVPKIIPISQAWVTYMLSRNFGYSPGIFAIEYTNDDPLDGNYRLYFKVEAGPRQSTEPENLGGILRSNPSVVTTGRSSFEVFVRNTENGLSQLSYRGPGDHSWINQPGTNDSLFTAPTAVAWGPGRIDVFGCQSDGQLLHRWSDGGAWGPNGTWEILGSPSRIVSPPTVCAMRPGRLDVFGLTSAGRLRQMVFDGANGWSDWFDVPVDATFINDITAISWGDQRIDIFGRATDNSLGHAWWDGANGWGAETLGGILTSGAGVSAGSAGRLDVFVRNTEGGLSHRWFDAGQGGWSSVWSQPPGRPASTPGAASFAPGRFDVFFQAEAGELRHIWWVDGGWRP